MFLIPPFSEANFLSRFLPLLIGKLKKEGLYLMIISAIVYSNSYFHDESVNLRKKKKTFPFIRFNITIKHLSEETLQQQFLAQRSLSSTSTELYT